MYRLGSREGDIAPIAWERMNMLLPSGTGCEKGCPKFSSWAWMRDNCPGGEYSGCPGSRSNTATPVTLVTFELSVSGATEDKIRLTSNLAKVDFPEDLGPQIMIVDVLWAVEVEDLERVSFHSGGEING